MWWRLHPRQCAQTLQGALPRFACQRSSHALFSKAANKKGKAAPLQERRMMDRVRLWAKGGNGGNGCWSTRRSRVDPHGKPDGGNGGRGGDVILECSSDVWDFSNLRRHLNAKRGGHGLSKKMIGCHGSDQVGRVPVGTVVHLVSGEAPQFIQSSSSVYNPWEAPSTDLSCTNSSSWNEEINRNISTSVQIPSDNIDSMISECDRIETLNHWEREVNEFDKEFVTVEEEEFEEQELEETVMIYSVAELTVPGQRLLVARGGEGGLGNSSIRKDRRAIEKEEFSKDEKISSSMTTGEVGSETLLILELKSIADIGLVGMPNAGKSTLLGAISRAKPAVGDYAFTTLRPNIGNLSYDDFFSVTVADIPGILEGAHQNRGLGHAFLRHIERTKVLVYVLDLVSGLDGRKGAPPWEQLRVLVSELEHYQQGMSSRPSLIVANKIDENGAEAVYEELKCRVGGNVSVFPVSAILEEGVTELKAGLRSLMKSGCSTRISFQ